MLIINDSPNRVHVFTYNSGDGLFAVPARQYSLGPQEMGWHIVDRGKHQDDTRLKFVDGNTEIHKPSDGIYADDATIRIDRYSNVTPASTAWLLPIPSSSQILPSGVRAVGYGQGFQVDPHGSVQKLVSPAGNYYLGLRPDGTLLLADTQFNQPVWQTSVPGAMYMTFADGVIWLQDGNWRVVDQCSNFAGDAQLGIRDRSSAVGAAVQITKMNGFLVWERPSDPSAFYP